MIIVDTDRTFSDGMCGTAAMMDTETGKKVKISWSISNPVHRSQESAMAEARKILKEA